MKIIQSLNQNALLVVNANGEEAVALGRGIGFGKRKGDSISLDDISRIFTIQSSVNEKKFLELFRNIEDNTYSMAEDVVILAEKLLNTHFNDSFIFTIAKHIQFSIERNKEIDIEYEPFEYQLKYLYPEEYKASKKVIEFINNKYHLKMRSQEVSFFTLHFVNSLIDSEDFSDILKLSNLLNEIVSFIEIESNYNLKKEEIEYSRFIVHLRYFFIRNLSKSKKTNNDSRMNNLLYLIKEMYNEESLLLEKLKEKLFIDNQLSFESDEDLYLLLHLVRILRKKEC